jgi:hypothetical protein
LEIQAHESVYLEINTETTNSSTGKLRDYFTINDGALNRVDDQDEAFVTALESGTLDVDGKIPNAFKISDVSSITDAAFDSCTYLSDSTTLINTLQFVLSSTNNTLLINYEAFYNCTNLRCIEFESSAGAVAPLDVSIASFAFDGCTNLQRIEFDTSSGDATVSIGFFTFAGCANLTGL